MNIELSKEELDFLQSMLLDAQHKAGQVPPGPWKHAIKNNPRKIAELWGKLHALEDSLASTVEPDLWVSEQHGALVAIPGYDTPDTRVYKNWRKAYFAD